MPHPSALTIESLAASCQPIARETISAQHAAHLASLLKAVADPARLRIISMLAASETGEVCVCDFTKLLGLSQGTVSHHLKVLQEAQIVSRDRRGTWSYYRIEASALNALSGLLGN